MAKKKTDTVNEPLTANEIAEWTPDPDERHYPVAFTLPMGVLIALLDIDHPMADVRGADHFGLIGIEKGKLTPLGDLVVAGIDQVAIRHKMNAEWRRLHNLEIDRRP